MANALQLRRGTTAQHSTFTGLAGEVTVDTTKNTIVVHDGSTAGGHPLASSLSSLGITASAADLNTTDVTTLGTVEASKVVTAGASGNVTFGDDQTANFGSGNDLQILHNSSNNNSIIREVGTGVLSIQTNGSQITFFDSTNTAQMGSFNTGGSVDLSYAGTTRFSTTSNGVDITGNLNADSITLNDGAIAYFGTGNDLQIYHSGAGSFIDDTGTGNLHLRASTALWVQNAGGTGTMIYAQDGDKVRLYHNNNAKLDTTSSGISVTGSTRETDYSLTGTAIDPANGGVQYKTLSANTTFTENLSNGDSVVLHLSGGSSYTITWPTMTWAGPDGNTEPTLTANDVIVIWQSNSTVYGAHVGSAA